MSESDSNSEKSYDSDDSDVNFIPGYVNIEATEVEDANTVDEPVALTSSLDPDTYQPYEDEPIAFDEWVPNTKKSKKPKLSSSESFMMGSKT